MQRFDHEDPDSGHPTPRDEFNPEEATTSTPISFRRRPSGIRPNSSDLFSPRDSPRFSNSHSDEYKTVNNVIEIVRKNKQMEEEIDELRNQSMMSEQELETSKARIAELEEQARYFTWAGDLPSDGVKEEASSSTLTGYDEKWKEQEERWRKERERMKKEMEEKLREIEKKRVDEMMEWQFKCEEMEAEREFHRCIPSSEMERIEGLLKEKEEEIDQLKGILRNGDRDSLSDSGSIRALEREVREAKSAIEDQTMHEEEVERMNKRMAIESLRRRNGEMEELLRRREKEIEELRVSMEEEKRTMTEAMEAEKEQIMERAKSHVERNEELMKEKEEEMREEVRRKEKEVEELMEEGKRTGKQMEESEKEMSEVRRRLEESVLIMKGMDEEKREMEVEREKIEKEMEEMREKVGELEQSLDAARTECARIANLEGKIRELHLQKKATEEAEREATKQYQELKSMREGELAEALTLREKIDEQTSIIDNLKREKEELEEKRKESEKTAEELRVKMEEERRMNEEKEEEMKDELRGKVKEVEGMIEEVERRQKQMEESAKEMSEVRRRLEESVLIMKGMDEEKREMEVEREKSEKEMEEMREKLGEVEQSLDAARREGARIIDLERKIREVEQKYTVAEEAARDATKHYQDLKWIREEEMAETLAVKTKVHEQKLIIDNLKRVNEELEEKRKESEKTTEELRVMKEEEKRRISEMGELRRDVERRREKQKKMEDELEIARKISEEAKCETKRVKEEMKKAREEMEKEKEERRMEWMNKDLRESEALKMKMEKEREESERRVMEALSEVAKVQHLYEELNKQYIDFQNDAQHQYVTELAEKEEELNAMRDRLAELENYPGMVVSVDGRNSEGRSIYDLLPIQLKDSIDQNTDENVRRAVEFCKRLMVRGSIEPPSHLPLLIERMEALEMQTQVFQDHVYFFARIFKKMDEEEGTEEQMTAIAGEMENELSGLEIEWKSMEKRVVDSTERLRRSDEERRRMEEEAIRADEGRKRTLNEMKDLRAKLVRITAEKEEMAEAARESLELHDQRYQDVQEADEELEQMKEKYQELEVELSEKEAEIRKWMDELGELEEKLEEEIERNKEMSRKLADERTTVRNLNAEMNTKMAEIVRLKSGKEKLKKLAKDLVTGMNNHFAVYTKVKTRSEKRQKLLDFTRAEIEKTRKAIGENQVLKKLEETIVSEVDNFLAEDIVDKRESKKIRETFQSQTHDKENWENY